jgi:hypothetical protein
LRAATNIFSKAATASSSVTGDPTSDAGDDAPTRAAAKFCTRSAEAAANKSKKICNNHILIILKNLYSPLSTSKLKNSDQDKA